MKHALFFGIALSGLTLGYIVGGSSTPVVGAIAPSLVGIGLLAFAILQRSVIHDVIKESIKSDSSAKNFEALFKEVRAEMQLSAQQIGTALICFFTLFLIGTVAGHYARTRAIFAPNPTATLPWEGTDFRPQHREDALLLISIAQQMDSAGYSPASIKEIIQLASGPNPLPDYENFLSNWQLPALTGDRLFYHIRKPLEDLPPPPSQD